MSSDEIPQKMRALVVQKGGVAKVQEIPIPELADHEILVKTKASTLNPSDWKHIKLMSPPGCIPGIDFAGVIVKLGKILDPSVNWKVGDRVAGATHGGAYKDRGSFADYLKADAQMVWKIPDELSFEDAATLNASPMTAWQALFHPDRLDLVEPPEQVKEETWIFIYGGSTTVGISAIQFAHYAGYKIVTTASPRNFDLLKGFGADVVFDYRDKDVVSKVKKASGDTIHSVLDCHSEVESQEMSVNVMAPGPGKVITLLMASKLAVKMRPDVAVQATWLYAAFGADWPLLGIMQPASPGDKRQIMEFMANKLPGFLADGKLKPMKIKLYENGLQDIKKGIAYMISGKLSAEKVVFKMK